MASLLGFSEISRNSLDAVSDRDFIVEHLAALSLVALHLSPPGGGAGAAVDRRVQLRQTRRELHYWLEHHAAEAEPGRGRAGAARRQGCTAAWSPCSPRSKGLPLSYNRDLQEDKAPLFEAAEVVHDGLALMCAMVETAEWDVERLARAADDPLISATDLADHLTRRGMPFRDAHEVIGTLVKRAETEGRSLASYSLTELQSVSPLFDAEAVGLQPECW